MASAKKQIQQLAKQFFNLSLENGVVSPTRVAGVLAYVETHRPPHAVAVLKDYQRLVKAEIDRSQAVVEHAGPVHDSLVTSIAESMTKRYRRPIAGIGRRNDSLLAGLRVRVGDDVYESSIAGQLAALANAV
jgi:F-type H+-transporting ATPase subunit delta